MSLDREIMVAFTQIHDELVAKLSSDTADNTWLNTKNFLMEKDYTKGELICAALALGMAIERVGE